ncbi:structural protein MipA [Cellvibrio zantedeschiae]|uniref:Structural protein MipA n=1 Tax=Cellvibrio zantedeschiae TaxID=1237077 RepID=A0ABQ3BB97_9GAMM|nr:MipA/OmpV family protein [Cellvibrio zantedeschiae]GGY84100.1 structural protein MipA [Cellvibrio zantedeschiae]
MIIVKSRFHRTFLAFVALLILNLSIIAQSWAAEDESRWQFSIGLGLGVRTNPVMDNDDIPLVILPQFSYQGERFFIQNLDLGYNLFQNNKQELNILLTPSYDQIFFNEWDISNFVDRSNLASMAGGAKDSPSLEANNRAIDKSRLHDRHVAALAGVEYSHTIYDVDIQVQLLQEATGYYDGNEARLAISKSINVGKHDVKLTLGANWQNAATINYFYGLPERESPGNFAYEPNAGLTSLLRFDWAYQLDEHWSLRFFTSYRHLSHSISNSPLVTENNVVTAFAGGVYHF